MVEDLSAGKSADWISRSSVWDGVERIEAFFSGRAYQRHRHDTYAIGRTIRGVQRFHYRGEVRDGLPGTAIVLHPDEPHDGQAGTPEGFHYKLVYLDPTLLQAALGGSRSLPFVPGGVSHAPGLLKAVDAIVGDAEEPMEKLQFEDAIFDLVQAMQGIATEGGSERIRSHDASAANRDREFILDNLGTSVTLDQLQAVADRDRWQLSRDFRALFGTSPYRYLIMRRLDLAKAAIAEGRPLAQAAIDAGFADQAHLTRLFTRAFGLPPSRWRRLSRD